MQNSHKTTIPQPMIPHCNYPPESTFNITTTNFKHPARTALLNFIYTFINLKQVGFLKANQFLQFNLVLFNRFDNWSI